MDMQGLHILLDVASGMCLSALHECSPEIRVFIIPDTHTDDLLSSFPWGMVFFATLALEEVVLAGVLLIGLGSRGMPSEIWACVILS
jgi:hypothetical protein